MLKPKYYLAKDHSFVIENYSQAPTFSSFLPGISGEYGCPMWAFYTNRGQCIASAGVKDKNGALIEFLPANKAYRSVSLTGFRTFLKVNGKFYEPFSDVTKCKNELRIYTDHIHISEVNPGLKIKVEVAYFTIPNENYPAMARQLKITNLSKQARKIEVIDGLPIIIPFGFDNALLKNISRTIEAWCAATSIDPETAFFKLKIMPVDDAEITTIDRGNFYTASSNQGKVKIITDPKLVFGETSNLEQPTAFIHGRAINVPIKLCTEGFTPSAFIYKQAKLGKELEINVLMGQVESLDQLKAIKKQSLKQDYYPQKASQNHEIMHKLSSFIDTHSSQPNFDLYAKQTFIDNVMRGGYPLKFGENILYIYFRKHGDMERDYNDFLLMPNYLSQGSGNYRDVNQNRRNDVFFFPETAEDNIISFFNLVQLDGYNPLVVLGTKYYLDNASTSQAIISRHVLDPAADLAEKLTAPFVIGELIKSLQFKTSAKAFAKDVLSKAKAQENALHAEGFWTDHFFYNLDLLKSFESVYPEKMFDLLFSKKIFTFFDNDHVVLPRSKKLVQPNSHVRQFGSVKLDAGKKPGLVRSQSGKGAVYTTYLAVKLLCAIANKAASFDAFGMGIEMEADKPDWYDALNGLPGLMGSSLNETLELKRAGNFLLNKISAAKKGFTLAEEINDFIAGLNALLTKEKDAFKYWDAASSLKEEFRSKVRMGVSGKEVSADLELIKAFLSRVITKCSLGIDACLKKYKTYVTYFINEAVDFEKQGSLIAIKQFKQTPLPLFLEGFVHALKVEKDRKVYSMVKQSRLYDKKLKMYKVNAPLNKAPIEIGRARIFTPGWLENESIWMHMEYKYMLELIKAGMYKEFFADFKNIMVPFMDPKVYKRSILENSSFIVSSANPNQHNHGRGFVARLSGAAAEFLDIWLYMTSGKKIFSLNKQGELVFKLAPVLPKWMFKKGEFSFMLLGHIPVTYINKKNKDTFDKSVSIKSYRLVYDNHEVEINKPALTGLAAQDVRSLQVKKIIVTLS